VIARQLQPHATQTASRLRSSSWTQSPSGVQRDVSRSGNYRPVTVRLLEQSGTWRVQALIAVKATFAGFARMRGTLRQRNRGC
jgi:hypothetical protein